MTAANHHPLPLWLRLCAAVLAWQVFCIGLLAASPRLHSHVHHDCAAADHVCAATLFAQGIDPQVPAPVCPAPVITLVVGELQIAVVVAGAAPALRLPPICGPPRA